MMNRGRDERVEMMTAITIRPAMHFTACEGTPANAPIFGPAGSRQSHITNAFARKQFMKKILWIPFALCLLGLSATAAHAQTYTFSGTVTTPDGLSNEFVSGASIVVEPGNHTATTDGDGKFSMPLQAGTYTVTTSASGYTGYTMDLKMDDTKHVVLSIAPSSGLESARLSLGGRVVAAGGSSAGIKGAAVQVMPGNYTATTGADGAFALPNLGRGTYQVSASAPGYQTATVDVDFSSSKQIVLSLQPGASR